MEDDTLSAEIVQERMAEHKQALGALAARKSALEGELTQATTGDVSTELVWDALSRFHETLTAAGHDLQRRLLAALIDRITVTKERVVDQVLLAFDPLSLLCTLEAESFTPSSVTFIYDTAHRG